MPAKPKKVGRPTLPKGNAKAVMLRVRVTADDLKAMKNTAKGSGKNVSEWIRGTLRTAANA
jgi:predicted DNA binding CopG/RHH family protein